MSNLKPQIKNTPIKSISVLVSIGRHPISGAARYCRNDAISLSLGLQLAESLSAHVDVLSATDFAKPDNPAMAEYLALSDYLALGAHEVKVVATEIGENIIPSLVKNINTSKPDLILTGSRAENGEDSGLLPYLIAEKLGLPIIANVLEIKLAETGLEVLQFLPKGKRRRVAISLPALVVIHPLAPVELYYAASKKKTVEITWLPSTDLPSRSNELLLHAISSKPAKEHKPEKLKVQDGQYEAKKTGHERLMAAITTEAKGGAVVIDTSCVEKAQVILGYLREHHLINF